MAAAATHMPPPDDLGARTQLLADKHAEYILGFSRVRPPGLLDDRIRTSQARLPL